jgi:hypothetical protein
MLCPCWTKKIVNKTEAIWGTNAKGQKTAIGSHKVKKEDVLICGKKAVIFLRVYYKELNHWRRNEGKHEDLFGFCPEHGELLSNLAGWGAVHDQADYRRGGVVSGQRGSVGRVEIVTEGIDMDAQAKEDKNLRVVAAIKQNIKRTMRQVNTRNLTVDHWRQCFEETLNEWIVEQVQDS